jgi:hypothetical protein
MGNSLSQWRRFFPASNAEAFEPASSVEPDDKLEPERVLFKLVRVNLRQNWVRISKEVLLCLHSGCGQDGLSVG